MTFHGSNQTPSCTRYEAVLILSVDLRLSSSLFIIYLLGNIWEQKIPMVFFCIFAQNFLNIHIMFFS